MVLLTTAGLSGPAGTMAGKASASARVHTHGNAPGAWPRRSAAAFSWVIGVTPMVSHGGLCEKPHAAEQGQSVRPPCTDTAAERGFRLRNEQKQTEAGSIVLSAKTGKALLIVQLRLQASRIQASSGISQQAGLGRGMTKGDHFTRNHTRKLQQPVAVDLPGQMQWVPPGAGGSCSAGQLPLLLFVMFRRCLLCYQMMGQNSPVHAG